MRLFDAILDANQRAADGHAPPLIPDEFADALPLVALTCIDARLNHRLPEALGVPESHFIWLRNAGNIITSPMSSTVRSLALACAVKGGKEVLILGHSDCLVRKTSTLELLDKFAALGVPRAKLPENLQDFFGLFASERQNVLKAVEHIRASPLIGPRVPVHGALLDLATGRLEVLVNGYQVFATANAGMSPMTERAAGAARQPVPVPPASEAPGNLSLAEIQVTSRQIGESVTPLRLESTVMPAIPETTPVAAAHSAPVKPPPVPVDPVAALKRVVDLARHYRIIGGDGKQYGPVPATVLLRWINDGRVDADTSVKVDGTNAWVKLHELGEAISRLRGSRK
jgi:carbonic anhydrase